MERVRWEERECGLNKQGLSPEQLSQRRRKVARLWRVALALAESADWGLVELLAATPVGSLQELLDHWLLASTAQSAPPGGFGALLERLAPELGNLASLARYGLLVYSRWLVSVSVFLRAPRLPRPHSPALCLAALEAAKSLFSQPEMVDLVTSASSILCVSEDESV